MDYMNLLTPVVGGVIGYFTNWLAIKMLFHPRREIYCMGFKLPFTPGVLPKSKARLAHSVGQTVGNYLLTDETLKQAIMDSNIDFGRIMDDFYLKLETNEKTVGHYISSILGDDYESAVAEAEKGLYSSLEKYVKTSGIVDKISASIADIVKTYLAENKLSMVTGNASAEIRKYLEANKADIFNKANIKGFIGGFTEKSLTDAARGKEKLGDFIPEEAAGNIKNHITAYMPKVSAYLAEVIENNEKLNESLLELTRNVVEDSIGSLIGSMVYNKVYRSIKENALSYISNPENMIIFAEKAGEKLDEILNMDIGAVEGFLRGQKGFIDGVTDKLAAFVADNDESLIRRAVETAENVVSPIGDMSIYDGIIKFMPDFDSRLESAISSGILSIVDNNMEGAFKSVFIQVKDKALGEKISGLISRLGKNNYEKVKQWALLKKDSLIERASAAISEKLDIKGIVEEKINELDMEQIEKIILEVAKKELNYITYMGGVLGMIIGVIPLLFR